MLKNPFITDGGLETTLIFHEGFDLPCFAAFTVLEHDEGREALRRYYRSYAHIAGKLGTGFIFESPTWRASSDWGKILQVADEKLDAYNRMAIEFLRELRVEIEAEGTTALISGCIGPRGDGYSPTMLMSTAEAEDYHLPQIRTLSESGVDLVSAFTMTNKDEAIGITQAASNSHFSKPK